jgi:hypothetical protein
MSRPPSGVTGPSTFPTFSLASTNAKMLPENMTVPVMINGAAYLEIAAGAFRMSSDGFAAWTEMARSARPL